MRNHALLSASKAHRWLVCTPSARLEERFPDIQSEYAKEGERAHRIAEVKARENFFDEWVKTEVVPTEMNEYTDAYIEFIANKLTPYAELLIEAKLDYSRWVKEGFGTVDCVIVSDDRLEIIDFKYGKGHLVDAYENPQMMLYALGAIEAFGSIYDFDKVVMSIFQPRIENGVSEYTLSVTELLGWANHYVMPRAEQAYLGKGKFMPSAETCRFCKAKEQCKARANANLALFDDNQDLRLITPEHAGGILLEAADIESWLEDLRNLVTNTLLKGIKISGWKLVEGRSIRKYISEADVVQAMIKAGYDKALLFEEKLMTLTELEKQFGKNEVGNILKNLIIKPAGKPTLALQRDKRPAINPAEALLAQFGDD